MVESKILFLKPFSFVVVLLHCGPHRVLERGEKIELLVDKTDRLNQQAFRFEASSRSLRRAMYWKKIRCYVIIGVISVLVIYAASVSLCGFDYHHCSANQDP